MIEIVDRTIGYMHSAFMRGLKMQEYRLYRLQGEHMVRSGTFRAETDTTATVIAEDALEGLAGELWCGTRLVKRISTLM